MSTTTTRRTLSPVAAKVPSIAIPTVIKWAGGKAWLVEDAKLAAKLSRPAPGCAYREPFLGGAAMYLGLFSGVAASEYALSDLNARLVIMYEAVRSQPELVITILADMPFSTALYLEVRDRFNRDWRTTPPAMVAAWFLYLNHAGFNGLYRENADGEYNVLVGRTSTGKAPTILHASAIRAASARLLKATLRCEGYEDALSRCGRGDVVFLDPPYVPASSSANFSQYLAGGFGPVDQMCLASILVDLDAMGVRFILTNADTEETRRMYSRWNIIGTSVMRSISALTGTNEDGTPRTTRTRAMEVLVCNV